MDGENVYDKIQEIFGNAHGNLNILEEKIDIDLQMDYFDCSRSVKMDLDRDWVLRNMKGIYNTKWSEEQKKELFASLASIEEVGAYRCIENYVKEGHSEIRNWAILALQESRMLMESALLDEDQVFISTGLGGKGSKLRYFIVLICKNDQEFSELQKKIVINEFDLSLRANDAEIESFDFSLSYATMLVIIPIKAPLKDMFYKAIGECNLYGDFLKSDFIVTNVRELSTEEINDFLSKQEREEPTQSD